MVFVRERGIGSWTKENFESLYHHPEIIGKEIEIGTENVKGMWREIPFILEIEVTLLIVEGWKKKKIAWNLHQLDQYPLLPREEVVEEDLQAEAYPPGQVERGQEEEEVAEVGDSNFVLGKSCSVRTKKEKVE